MTGKDRIVSLNKGTGERADLEAKLRALGVWDEVATLDTFALEDAVAGKIWAPEVKEAVKKYLTVEKRYTFTLSENKPK